MMTAHLLKEPRQSVSRSAGIAPVRQHGTRVTHAEMREHELARLRVCAPAKARRPRFASGVELRVTRMDAVSSPGDVKPQADPRSVESTTVRILKIVGDIAWCANGVRCDEI